MESSGNSSIIDDEYYTLKIRLNSGLQSGWWDVRNAAKTMSDKVSSLIIHDILNFPRHAYVAGGRELAAGLIESLPELIFV